MPGWRRPGRGARPGRLRAAGRATRHGSLSPDDGTERRAGTTCRGQGPLDESLRVGAPVLVTDGRAGGWPWRRSSEPWPASRTASCAACSPSRSPGWPRPASTWCRRAARLRSATPTPSWQATTGASPNWSADDAPHRKQQTACRRFYQPRSPEERTKRRPRWALPRSDGSPGCSSADHRQPLTTARPLLDRSRSGRWPQPSMATVASL